MKKIYVLLFLCSGFVSIGYSQNHFWVGGASGNWNSAANWSATSGGSGGVGVPNATNENAIFNSNASVTLDIDAVDLNILQVTNNATVRITAAAGGLFDTRSITVHSTNSGAPALDIDAGSRLEDSTETTAIFDFIFNDNSKGEIDGTWYLTAATEDDGATFTLPTSGASTLVNVNSGGAIVISPTGFSPVVDPVSEPFLMFNAGSTLQLMENNPTVPAGTFDDESTVLITGIVDGTVAFEELNEIGNLTYDCPDQDNGLISPSLNLGNNFTVLGDINILNTNGEELVLMNNQESLGAISATVNGDLNIQGSSSVVISDVDDDATTINFTVGGNLIANGVSLDIQKGSWGSGMEPTTLFVKGNISHTAGTLGVSSAATNNSLSLFNIELNGTTAQSITSTSGVLDDDNDQLTLRMNNAAGASLLSSFAVGRLDFKTANAGNITTGANVLTVTNSTPASTSGIVVQLADDPNDGYVIGTVRRVSASTDSLELPTGGAPGYRGVAVFPASADETQFQGTYNNTAFNQSNVLSPIEGVAGYYWEVERVSGTANAAVQLTIRGAVPGGDETDILVVTKYIGSNWTNVRGSGANPFITPGSATSGLIRSEIQTGFSFFTIGYGSSAALPIHLVSFNARRGQGSSANITWKITDNSTPEKFEIMKSNDGLNFRAIGVVPGAEYQHDYAFTDNSLDRGNNYYRLKMHDKDGRITFSSIVVVMNGNEGVVISSMMPTLVRDRAVLNVSSSRKGSMQLVVTDIQGRIVQNQVATITQGNQQVWLDATRLSSGMFQVTGFMNGEKTATIRFIKR